MSLPSVQTQPSARRASSDPLPAWRPLLTGERGERALQVVREIARDVRVRAEEDRKAFALGSGSAGCGIFYRYAGTVLSEPELEAVAVEELENAIAHLAEPEVRLDLYSGASGVALAVEYLRDPLLRPVAVPPEDDPCAEIDAAVLEELARPVWPRRLDLIDGLVGLGVYALSRLGRPAAGEMLHWVVHHLSAQAVHDPRGISWPIPPRLLPRDLREEYPEGCHDLGVAHGIPGIVAFLAEAWAAGVERATVAPLLEGGAEWLLAVRNPAGSDYAFPKFLGPDGRFSRSRLAWCYGDPGVALALLGAAAATGETAWRDAAVAVAVAASRRDPAAQGIADAGLCHGAAGVGHLYNRMFQATGEDPLRAAALFWFDVALRQRTPEARFGGYRCYAPLLSPSDTPWMDLPGFLMGSTGVGLALAAAASDSPPAWDLALLASGAARRHEGVHHG